MAAELVVLELNLSSEVADLGTTTQAQIRSQVKGAIVGVGVVEEVQIIKGDDMALVKILLSRVLAKGQSLIEALQKNENKTINIFGQDVPVSLGDSVLKGSGGGASTRGKKKAVEAAPVEESSGKGGKGAGRGGKGGAGGKGAGGKGGRGGGKGGGKGGRRSNICFDFQKGACDRDDCRFSHDLDAQNEEEEAPRPRRGKGGRRGGNQICFDFKNGRCERDDCRFSHDLEAAEAAAQRRPRGICFQFQEGNCERGEECRFSHNPADAEAAPPRQSRPKPVCYDFQQGKCQRDNCRFSHEAQEAGADGAADDGEGEWSQAPAQSSGRGRGRGGGRGRGRGRGGRGGGGSRVCYDFQKGQCERDNCKFSHEAQAADNAAEDA